MKEVTDEYLNLIFKVGLAIVIIATLFLFTNLTTEFYETPKFIVLVIFTTGILLISTIRYTLTGRVAIVRTPLDLPLLLLLVVASVSTVLSPGHYVSLLGNQLRISVSLVAILVYLLFYFMLTNNLKSIRDIRSIINLTLISGVALSVISLLSFFGVSFLPKSFPGAGGLNFTPTGSPFATNTILILLLPFVLSRILSNTNIVSKSINSLLLILFGTIIALTGTFNTFVTAIFVLVLSLAFNPSIRNFNFEQFWKDTSLLFVIAPLILITLVVLLSFIPPVGGAKNPFYTQGRNFPREIQLSFPVSWKISVSAFRDSPFWGSGPGSYTFDFTSYKPIEFNQSKFWNLRFDSGFNEYFQVLATLGGVGILALISLTALFLSSAWKDLVHPSSNIRTSLALSGVAFFVTLALHPSSLVVWIIGLIILASYSALRLLDNPHTQTYNEGENIGSTLMKVISSAYSGQSVTQTLRIEALPSVLLTVALAIVLATVFFGGKIVLADFHHRSALNAVSQNNGLLAYNELIAAEKLNPINDLYRTDLAQINFALANAIASAKGPTQASPSGSLTDQDKQNIQVLLQQSINEGRTSTTLSPKSAVNWEILALLYRQIAGVAQNALLFSLDSYGKAIFNDPLNPQLRLNVGGTYYAIKNYDLAIRFFTDAINLKPDFANGYYNLSVALRDKGDLNSALQMAEKVVQLVDKSSSDYKIATDYLEDLKNKVNPPKPAEPPAAGTTGELQNEQLPKVVNLPKPEKIATPEAVKKPSPTPTPTP